MINKILFWLGLTRWCNYQYLLDEYFSLLERYEGRLARAEALLADIRARLGYVHEVNSINENKEVTPVTAPSNE